MVPDPRGNVHQLWGILLDGCYYTGSTQNLKLYRHSHAVETSVMAITPRTPQESEGMIEALS